MKGIRALKEKGQPLIENFPDSATTALIYVLKDLDDRGYLKPHHEITLELNRIGRFTSQHLKDFDNNNFVNSVGARLFQLDWVNRMHFCERVYEKLIHIYSDFDYEENLNQAKEYFENEMNLILEEENINFIFEQGIFIRRGNAQTRKAIEGIGLVLSDERLSPVKKLFNKARTAFNKRPKPDIENCVKDALCALEAAIEILTGKESSKDFVKSINQLKGNGERQIPAPIAESIIKLYGYRGSAEGVGHAAIGGNRVSPVEAEFVLSIVATYITYLNSLFPKEEEIPF